MAWDLRRINNVYEPDGVDGCRSDYAIVKNPEYYLGKVKGNYEQPTWWNRGPLEPLSAVELRKIEWMRRPLEKLPRTESPNRRTKTGEGGGTGTGRRSSSTQALLGNSTLLSPKRSLPGSFTKALVEAATGGAAGPDGELEKGKWSPAHRHALDPLLSGSSNLLSSGGAMRHYTKVYEELNSVAKRIQDAPHRTPEFLDDRGCEELLSQMKEFQAASTKRERQKLALAKQTCWYKGHVEGRLGCIRHLGR